MLRSVARGLLLFVVLISWPSLASAQWFVSPYIGRTMIIDNAYADKAMAATPPDSATVYGVAAGTHIFGKLGIEIDFQHVSDMFRKGDSIFDLDSFTTVAGSNSLQSLTVVAHYGWPLGTEGRFRPYAVGGGGINFINLGHEVGLDFDTFESLPPSQQTAIENCFNALNTTTPTLTQVQGCQVPLMDGEQLTAQRGVLTFGGGMVFKLAKHFAARGDFRYFMGFPEDENGPFTFWRVTAGVVWTK